MTISFASILFRDCAKATIRSSRLLPPTMELKMPERSPAVVAELAPTGKLRAAINFGNPLLTAKDPATGEGKGIALDIAAELAGRLGVAVEIIPYDSPGTLAD